MWCNWHDHVLPPGPYAFCSVTYVCNNFPLLWSWKRWLFWSGHLLSFGGWQFLTFWCLITCLIFELQCGKHNLSPLSTSEKWEIIAHLSQVCDRTKCTLHLMYVIIHITCACFKLAGFNDFCKTIQVRKVKCTLIWIDCVHTEYALSWFKLNQSTFWGGLNVNCKWSG